MYSLFWKTAHPEYSLPLSLSLLSWAFKYSSTVYQTSQQRQAFHKPAYIIQVKKLTTHIHRHHDKCPTRLNLDVSTQIAWLQIFLLFHAILLPNSPSMFTLSPKAPFLLNIFLFSIWCSDIYSDIWPFSKFLLLSSSLSHQCHPCVLYTFHISVMFTASHARAQEQESVVLAARLADQWEYDEINWVLCYSA